MVLLPGVYLALIGSMVWWMIYCVRGLRLVVHDQAQPIGFYGYGGMLLIAAIVAAFLVKPLFAPHPRKEAPATLDMNQQPELRELISSLCAAIGAPVPVRVDVDCTVNASARLRRGLLSLGSKDLVLTLGLPLAGALDARQLAGVIAHELGHFAQGAGMATTYLIRSINSWFGRVVFERDAWDEALERWSHRLGLRVGVALWLARGLVWLTRRILHGLMILGHAAACWHLRQMEFDADYYSVAVAGTEGFVTTSSALRRLYFAERRAIRELGEYWRDRRLVDDYPGYLLARGGHLAPEIEREIEQQPVEQPRWFDTHPTDRARNDAAEAMHATGLFCDPRPGRDLFHQFEALSQEATSHYYREYLELEYDQSALLPTSTAVQPGSEAAEARRTLHEVIGPALCLWHPVLWSDAELQARPGNLEPLVLGRQLKQLRERLQTLRPAAETERQKLAAMRLDLVRARVGRDFFAAKIRIPPGLLGLQDATVSSAEARINVLEAAVAGAPAVLAEYENEIRTWGLLVIAIGRVFGDSLPNGLAGRIDALADRLVSFRSWFLACPEWSVQQAWFDVAVEHERLLDAQHNYTLLGLQCQKMRNLAANAPSMLPEVAWPLSPAFAPLSVKSRVERALENVPPAAHLSVLLALVAELYFDTLGRLAVYGLELEQVLAQAELE